MIKKKQYDDEHNDDDDGTNFALFLLLYFLSKFLTLSLPPKTFPHVLHYSVFFTSFFLCTFFALFFSLKNFCAGCDFFWLYENKHHHASPLCVTQVLPESSHKIFTFLILTNCCLYEMLMKFQNLCNYLLFQFCLFYG